MDLDSAISLHQKGLLQEALLVYQNILQEEPDNALALRLTGLAYWQSGDLKQAEHFLERALDISPHDPVLLSNWGLLWQSRGALERAIAIYEQALKISSSAGVYCNLGTALSHQKRWPQAERAFRNAISLDDQCWTAWWNLAATHREQSLWTAATDVLDRLHAELGESHQLANEYGLIAFGQKDWERAMTFFQRSVELNPNSAEALCNLALASRECHQSTERAFELLERALDVDPKYSKAYVHFALLLKEERQPQAALETLNFAIQQCPTDLDIRLNRAVLLAKTDPKEALDIVQSLTKEHAHHFDVWLQLGHLYLGQERLLEAQSAFHRCIDLRPEHPEAKYFSAVAQRTFPEDIPELYISNLFDGYARSFEEHLINELKYQTPHLLLELLQQKVSFPVARIVDLGCGTGLMGKLLQDKTRALIGVDLSSNMLLQAEKKQVYTTLVHQEMGVFLASQRNVDLLVAADVFNYLGQLSTILERSYQALHTEGWLAYSIERSNDDTERLEINGRTQHSPKQVIAQAEEVGFTLVCQQQAKLRKEKCEWVIGVLFLFQKAVLHEE